MISRIEVEGAIRSAFPEGNPPSSVTVGRNEADSSALAFFRKLEGKKWPVVTIADLRADLLGIVSLSDEAYRYYLPAYLILSLNDYFRMDFVVETLLTSLASPDYGDLTSDDFNHLKNGRMKSGSSKELDDATEYFRKQQDDHSNKGTRMTAYRNRMSGLTQGQLQVIRQFLLWLRQDHGEDDANSLISKAEASILELVK